MNDIKKLRKVLLFVDLHNFSIAAARLGDKTWEFIQAFYVLVGDIAVPEGRIIKYIGDAVFVVFNEGAELHAIDTALTIRERFADLARLFEIGDITEAEVGIGSGAVGFGTFGHSSLRVTDVSGEAVNEAAVIMHHRGVAITRSVYDVVSRVIECRPLPHFEAKWRDTPLERWEVIGPK